MSKRIDLLDVLRFVAVLMVMLFHFYWSFLGHYTKVITPPEILKYGYLGVELFFIISGFVITLTLDKCKDFREFAIKRMARLWPAMVICASITFLFVLLFDATDMHRSTNTISNLVVSYTFISPKLLNELFQTDFHYIDGAYWSLWVEITFYIVAGILYFANPKKLLRHYSIVTVVSLVLFFATVSHKGQYYVEPAVGTTIYAILKKFCEIFTFCEYALWFLIGMTLKNLFYDKQNKKMLVYFTGVFLIQTVLILNFYTFIFCLLVYLFLLLFVYRPEYLAFANVPLFQKLGLVSYSTYLLHGKISSVVLKHIAQLSTSKIVLVLAPLLLIIIISYISLHLYKVEGAISKRLKSLLLKKSTQSAP